MPENLVIVESPAKAKTIEKFLGQGYKVLSSYGHIRDLQKHGLSVDVENGYTPAYEVPEDKQKLVEELKDIAKKCTTVWLASDEDREGEAIAWHLFEVLELNPNNTKRIVFHEITKTAILKAIEEPRNIDINLVNAQQARRVLDRLVGFELSPVLWKKVKPSLSAGRVQSVAVRLIVEREREIKKFVSEASYKITATFTTNDGEDLKADYGVRFKTQDDAYRFLEQCKDCVFTVSDINKKPTRKTPAPPFTTSTLQQEAARKLGLSVGQTMSVAQHLYESGKITYMRTDSVNLSEQALSACRDIIGQQMGERYVKTRQFVTKSKGAQEAHEAIRPTYLKNETITGTNIEKKLYDLIWKRTVASQMADAEVEKTTVTIQADKCDDTFTAIGEVTLFDGFLKIYRESIDEDQLSETESHNLPKLNIGQFLQRTEILATERFTTCHPRYNEATLVREMETLGIGRPSTYAPIISTIQQRGYVEKSNREGITRQYNILNLQDDIISHSIKSEEVGREKNKLSPTDVGVVVNDFLMEYFRNIMDYNFTANVEKEFDEVAEGTKDWPTMIDCFYQEFHPLINEASNLKAEHKIGERMLGIDPDSGKPVSVKIGRFGPVIQIGTASDSEKPRFSQLPKGVNMENISLEKALESFRLPRLLGTFEGKNLTVGVGRFGPYVHHEDVYVSVPKTLDPLTMLLTDGIKLIIAKREAQNKNIISTFQADAPIVVMNGRFGPYISYKKSNYKIPHDYDSQNMSLEDCLKIINEQPKTRKTTQRTKSTKS